MPVPVYRYGFKKSDVQTLHPMIESAYECVWVQLTGIRLLYQSPVYFCSISGTVTYHFHAREYDKWSLSAAGWDYFSIVKNGIPQTPIYLLLQIRPGEHPACTVHDVVLAPLLSVGERKMQYIQDVAKWGNPVIRQRGDRAIALFKHPSRDLTIPACEWDKDQYGNYRRDVTKYLDPVRRYVSDR